MNQEKKIIKVPFIIRKNYIANEYLDMNLLYKEPFCSHKRLRVFASKGLKCVYCSNKGFFLIKTLCTAGRKLSVHIDIYTIDLILMTVDHRIPKSKGGTDDIENLFPCCYKCNTKKSTHSHEEMLNKRDC